MGRRGEIYHGRKNNQNFVNIPLGKIEKSLKYMCKEAGVNFHLQEESYTSKASFFDLSEYLLSLAK